MFWVGTLGAAEAARTELTSAVPPELPGDQSAGAEVGEGTCALLSLI